MDRLKDLKILSKIEIKKSVLCKVYWMDKD